MKIQVNGRQTSSRPFQTETLLLVSHRDLKVLQHTIMFTYKGATYKFPPNADREHFQFMIFRNPSPSSGPRPDIAIENLCFENKRLTLDLYTLFKTEFSKVGKIICICLFSPQTVTKN
jgi:hypothetical protein